MAEEIQTLSVSGGEVFPELDDNILPKRRRRTRRRDTYPRAVEKRQLQNLVKRLRVFDSRTDAPATFDSDGLVSLSNNGALNITSTITNNDGGLWMLVPEFSFYVDAVANSNQWPTGSFFSSASARQDDSNYDIISNIQEATSTNNSVKWVLRIVNRSGESVSVGVIMGIRFIVNRDRSPASN